VGFIEAVKQLIDLKGCNNAKTDVILDVKRILRYSLL